MVKSMARLMDSIVPEVDSEVPQIAALRMSCFVMALF